MNILSITALVVATISTLAALWLPKNKLRKICLSILALAGFTVATIIELTKEKVRLTNDPIPSSAYIKAKFEIDLDSIDLSCLTEQANVLTGATILLNNGALSDSKEFDSCKEISKLLTDSRISFYLTDSEDNERKRNALVMHMYKHNPEKPSFALRLDDMQTKLVLEIAGPVKIKRHQDSNISALQQFKNSFVWSEFVFIGQAGLNPFGKDGLILTNFWINVHDPDMTFNADKDSIAHKLYPINRDHVIGATFLLIDHATYAKKYGYGYTE